MDESKKMGLNILIIMCQNRFLKQGLLTKEEFKKADSYLYERYEIDKSFGYNWYKKDGRVKMLTTNLKLTFVATTNACH